VWSTLVRFTLAFAVAFGLVIASLWRNLDSAASQVPFGSLLIGLVVQILALVTALRGPYRNIENPGNRMLLIAVWILMFLFFLGVWVVSYVYAVAC